MTQLKKIGKLFPTLNTTVAYYDPATFYINLNTISQQELIDTRNAPFSHKYIENIKTIFHETRHNIDHVATLWGQKKILKYLRALNVRLKNDITKFDSIVAHKLEENQLFYADYYTEEYNYFPVDKMDKRWQWQATTGLKFSDKGLSDESRPIPMIHFKTHDGNPLIRIPISIASLLETNAVSEEIKMQLTFISSLSDTEKPFQLKFFEKETLLNLIYNQDLAVYNVAVHLAANLFNLSDIVEAFRISSAIATLALNLPTSLVTNLPVDEKQFGVWGERNKNMLLNHDHGFIYYILLFNYRPFYMKNKKLDVNDILLSSNLPKYAVVESIIENELQAIEDEIKSFDNLKELFLSKTTVGRQLLKSLGLCFEKMSIYEAVHQHKFIPTIICNDTDIKQIDYKASDIYKMQPIKQLDLSEWYNISWTLNLKLNELYEVRGV